MLKINFSNYTFILLDETNILLDILQISIPVKEYYKMLEAKRYGTDLLLDELDVKLSIVKNI
ncbi:12106_t:CDS:2 [Acaulospora morrowiae]|uniref:12106_t:CDS:1 n=1 Tax=Acaulospora morrowiae TaxID=94023 RepID=A0A9N8Z4G7_9GLOM|nr:12106_t:CDS:2 [Acaulospora morrowiae]